MSSDTQAGCCGAPLPSPPPAVTRIPVGRDDVVIEQGYCLEPVAIGLTFPTSLAFDEEGRLHVAEAGYSYGPARSAGEGRILRLGRDGEIGEVASGLRGPITGIACRGGSVYAAEGAFPGRIVRVDEDGEVTPLMDGLRSGGDHFTGDIAFGPDGRMYFGVGSVTNAAVVGVDNFFFGWLGSMPPLCDVPYRTTRLRGVNYVSANPFTLNQPAPCTSLTGAFKPFGIPSVPGEVIPGSLMANSVIYSAKLDGSDLRVVADGLRNPFGIGFCPCGALYVLDQGYDARGGRRGLPGRVTRHVVARASVHDETCGACKVFWEVPRERVRHSRHDLHAAWDSVAVQEALEVLCSREEVVSLAGDYVSFHAALDRGPDVRGELLDTANCRDYDDEPAERQRQRHGDREPSALRGTGEHYLVGIEPMRSAQAGQSLGDFGLAQGLVVPAVLTLGAHLRRLSRGEQKPQVVGCGTKKLDELRAGPVAPMEGEHQRWRRAIVPGQAV